MSGASLCNRVSSSTNRAMSWGGLIGNRQMVLQTVVKNDQKKMVWEDDWKEFLLFLSKLKHTQKKKKKGIKGVRWHARNIISLEILLKIVFHWLKPKKRRKILSVWVSILSVWLIRKKRLFYVYLSMFFLHDLGRLDLITYNAQPTGWVTGRMLANQGRASWESLVWEGR